VPSLGWVLALRLDSPEDSASLAFWFVEATESKAAGGRTLYAEGTLDLDGMLLDYEVSHLPILRVAFRPGLGLAVAGAAVALLLLLVTWVWAPRLAWIVCRPGPAGQTAVEFSAPPGPGGRFWLRRLAEGLREGLGDGA